jgi:predicted DNA-binding transcriptional regulator AlpA
MGQDGKATVVLNGVRDAPRLALRPRNAAKALGIGERKLWAITADKTSGIPHVRLGKAVVYPVAPLEAWLARRAEGERSENRHST